MRPIDGRHVLFGLLAFFGVMFAVNGVFVYFATTTFSGLSEEHAYQKGLHYNETIAAYKSQRALAWAHHAEIVGDHVELRVSDADEKPVSNLEVIGTMRRPATDDEDRTLAFRHAGPGIYVAEVGPFEPGQWQLEAEAKPYGKPQAPLYRMTARLWWD